MSIFSRHSRVTAVVLGAATALGVGGTVLGVQAANSPSVSPASSAGGTTTPAKADRTRRRELGEVTSLSATSLTLKLSSGQSVTIPLSTTTHFRSASGALEQSSSIKTGELVRVVLVRGDSFSTSGSPSGSVTVRRVRDLGFQVSSS